MVLVNVSSSSRLTAAASLIAVIVIVVSNEQVHKIISSCHAAIPTSSNLKNAKKAPQHGKWQASTGKN